jgi:hypothetical protein
MYYLKIQDENGTVSDTLIYYCRNCGHEDTTLSTTNICVSDIQLRTSEKKYTHIVNEYTKYDPTLPRINTIKCPNQECASNHYGGGAGKKTTKAEGTEAAEAATEAAKTVRKRATIKKTAKNDLAEQAQAQQTQAQQTQAAEQQAKAQMEQQIEEEDAQAQAQQEQTQHMEQTQQPDDVSSAENNREVIYIRYDDTNMKYVYLCVHCDTTWRTDNRI